LQIIDTELNLLTFPKAVSVLSK